MFYNLLGNYTRENIIEEEVCSSVEGKQKILCKKEADDGIGEEDDIDDTVLVHMKRLSYKKCPLMNSSS